ncbi:hypothetical protein ACLB2K_037358 [Fragaria x ananassa]
MAIRPFGLACVTLLVLVPMPLLCSTSVKAQTEDYCSVVFEEFGPCLSFVGGLSPYPMEDCCESITNLNHLAKQEQSGPQKICECIENFSYWTETRFIASRIMELPTSCMLHLSFPISDSMDCSM